MFAKLKKDAKPNTLVVEFGTKRYEFNKKTATETASGVFGLHQDVLEEVAEASSETPVTQEEPQGE